MKPAPVSTPSASASAARRHHSRNNRLSWRTLGAIALALALFGTACGSGSGDDAVDEALAVDSSDAEESAEAASEPDDEPEASEPEEREESDEPDADAEPGEALGDLIGIPIGDEDEMEEYFGQLQIDAERKTAECMAQQGFEYTAADYSQLDGLGNVDTDSREYAEEYGFGIATDEFQDFAEVFENFEDPNADYVASLSEGELAAYQVALDGEELDDSQDFSGFPEFGGCRGDAFEEMFSFITVFTEFESEFSELEELSESDPRVLEANKDWSSCMADKGYQAVDFEDIEKQFRGRFDAIVNQPDAYVEDDFEAPEGDDGDDGEIVFFGRPELKPEFQSQVDALGVEEVEAATAAWDCGEDLRETQRIVDVELERRFIDENGARITELLGE